MKPKRIWTSEDDSNLKRLNAAGMCAREIGRLMGRHPDVIGRHIRSLRLRPGQTPIHTMMMARINARRMALAA